MSDTAESTTDWWNTKALEDLTDQQWEALCDGCGRCCMVKVWRDSKVRLTKIGCRLLDIKTAKCRDYENRFSLVSNCRKITFENIDTPGLLPDTCAYVLRRKGLPLHDWHHLVSGSRDTVREAGISIIGVAEVNEGIDSMIKQSKYFLQLID